MEIVKQQEAQVFNYELGQIRVIVENGEPLFMAMDVAQALGYTDTEAMTRRLDNDEIQNRQIVGFGNRGVNLINESGLYSAILGSKKDNAKNFKKWITQEVLPSIRKNGGYIANQENMTPEQIVANALIVAQNIIADRDKTIAEQKEVIEYQGGKLENFTSVEKTRRSRQELSTKLNRTIRLLAEQKFNKDYGKAYTYIYGEFAKLHCIADKVNMDYLKKNIDYLAECLAIATTELD